eukprot:TRINITY_DN1890_c1_g3_i1.p2 TRINITY_DN1890_c1_g3~~TRINITY_DN1890_c1_g3_i1.p2  ORF type:complete len:180 (+),score=30.58 TRINITY_DN1890_c1_g3_i1:79-540(+)
MCEVLSWEIDTLSRSDDNEGVHALNETELDEMLGNLSVTGSVHSLSGSGSGSVSGSEGGSCSEEESVRPPCSHNCWDNLRAKRETVTLRCRQCQKQWKTQALRLKRCPNFSRTSKMTCQDGESCPLIHVFRFKLSSKKRSKMLKEQAMQRESE